MSSAEPEIIVTHLANSSLAGKEQHFKKDRITVGRDGGTDVEFDPDEDLYVSHRHAEIYLEDGGLHLRDLESRNGTYLNQKRISMPVLVQPGDTIHFGANGPLIRARIAGAAGDTVFDPASISSVAAATKRSHESGAMAQSAVGTKKGKAGRYPPPISAPPEEQYGGPPMLGPTGQMGSPPGFPPPHSGGSSLLRWVLTIVIGAGLGVGGLYVYNNLKRPADDHAESGNRATSGPSAATPAGGITALGRLEPDGGILTIGGPAGQTIKKVLVVEGQTVKAGDPLVYLKSQDALQAEYEAARSAEADATAQMDSTKAYAAALVGEARAAVEMTQKPLDLEVSGIEAQVNLLQANLNVATEDRKQLEQMGNQANPAQLTRQKMVEQASERELTAAQKKLDQLRASLEPRRAQARAGLDTALANQTRMEKSISLEAAHKNVERAKAQLDQATLAAPRDGTVLKILAREGTALGGQTILWLGDTRRMTVRAEIYETDVRHLKEGQSVTISGDALPDKLQGKVEKILWTVQNNAVRSLDPLMPEDLRVVDARVRIDDRDVERYGPVLQRLINLQVMVNIPKD